MLQNRYTDSMKRFSYSQRDGLRTAFSRGTWEMMTTSEIVTNTAIQLEYFIVFFPIFSII